MFVRFCGVTFCNKLDLFEAIFNSKFVFPSRTTIPTPSLGPGTNVIKLFTVVNYELASLFYLVYYLWTRPGAYPRLENLKSVSLR
jgi:hypothetical protein